MAKKDKGKQQFTTSQKLDYYNQRKDDVTLTDGQRRWAANRVADIECGKMSSGGRKSKKKPRKSGNGNKRNTRSISVRWTN